jgi:hypothetical protein
MSQSLDPAWWTAVLVDRISVRGTESSFSIRLVLVRATDAENARSRATSLGAAGNQTYKNADGEDVAWECVEVLDAHGLLDATVDDGTELYSFFVSGKLLDEIRDRMSAAGEGFSGAD